jgi:hypothetical protein
MKIQILAIFTIVLLLCSIAMDGYATETREFSMGQTGLFMYDNSNIVYFPGRVMSYGNQIVTELRVKGAENLFSAEVRLPVNSYMLGANFNRPISVYNPGVGQNIMLNQTTDLYFGTPLGDNNLGVRLSLGRDGYKRDSTAFQTKLDESARYFEVGAGLSGDYFDAGVSVAFPSIKSEESNLKDEYSGTDISLIGRYFYEQNSRMQFVPVIAFETGSASRKTDVAAGQPQEKTDYSVLAFSLGVGLNFQIDENNLLILAIDPYRYHRDKEKIKDGPEYTTTTTAMPRLYLGVETTIKPWLTGRLGANRIYQNTVEKVKPVQGNEVETSYQSSDYIVSFGLGLKFGKFIFDLQINNDFLFEGPNFISGQIGDFSNRVSASYQF